MSAERRESRTPSPEIEAVLPMLRPFAIAAALLIPAATQAADTVRFATFNASLNRDKAGDLVRDLSTTENVQAGNVAEIVQRVRPDILLINEFDYDPEGKAVVLFRKNYLKVGRNGTEPIDYPYHYTAEVNTGLPSGVDLDNDGKVAGQAGSRGYGNDAFGFGQFPGQYGMVVYSRFPIDAKRVASFQKLRWKDVPGALAPKKPDGSPYYSDAAWDIFRLPSKSHWDVPIALPHGEVHLLVSHPTPPAFDGPERRNVKRNHDEIRLWADFLTGGDASKYLGSPTPPARFVLMGDQNADPVDGASENGAILQLLKHPRIDATFIPASEGGAEASDRQGQKNATHKGVPAQDTADFADGGVGNLRVDYVLPSKGLKVTGGGVFWPKESDPLSRLVKMSPVASSDHRLVYIDVDAASIAK